MNILKNRTVLGLICIVLSLIICFGLTPLFNNAIKSQVDIVRIVKEVKKGDVITSDMVAVIKVGGYNLPENVLKEKESVIGKYAKSDFANGDYILSDKLSDKPLAEFEYLAELDGEHQAMSITIKSFAAGLSGKLEAGDIVSLIASDFGDFRQTLSPPELQYVKVIAVTDGKGYDKEYAEKTSDEEEKALPSTVTLLVVPAQAELLAELETKSKLHCSLVYRGDSENASKFLETQDEYLQALVETAEEATAPSAAQAETSKSEEVLPSE